MNNRLYVGNLSFHTTEEELHHAFAEFGNVSEVKIVLDRDTGRSRGFAFVQMESSDDARKAIENMDGATLDGRSLRVSEAEERRPREGGGGGGGGFSRGDRGDRGDRGGGRGGRGGGGDRRNRW